jgi:hypothetical protein
MGKHVQYQRGLLRQTSSIHPKWIFERASYHGAQPEYFRILDGFSASLIKTRVLDPPFQSVDSNCADIPNTVGSTGTPIIDPSTDTMYFCSKGYKGSWTNQTSSRLKSRYFVGGTVLQRPALASIGNIIIAGFGDTVIISTTQECL